MSKQRLWYPIAIGFTLLNVAGAGYAGALEDPGHAATHLALTGVGALWAWRLGRRRPADTTSAGMIDREERLESLEAELEVQRRELAEAHERLDFAERLLTQAADQRRESERDRLTS